MYQPKLKNGDFICMKCPNIRADKKYHHFYASSGATLYCYTCKTWIQDHIKLLDGSPNKPQT